MGERGEGGVFAAIEAEDEALTFAVFGDEAEAGAEGAFDGTEGEDLVGEFDLAGDGAVEAEDGLDDFAAAGADDPGEADDLARADGEVDVGEGAGGGEVFNGEADGVGGAGYCLRCGLPAGRAARSQRWRGV